MATSNKKQLLKTLEQLGEKELKKFKWFLQNEVPDGFDPIPKNKLENADELDTVDKMVETYGLKGALKITVETLSEMNQHDLSELLSVSGAEEAGGNTSTSCLPQEVQGSSNKTEIGGHAAAPGGNPSEQIECHDKYAENIKDNKLKHQRLLKSKYEKIVDGMKQHGEKISLDSIYTELYITEAGGGDVNDQHEVRQIEGEYRKIRGSEKKVEFNNIFKSSDEQDKLIRRVLTKGIAGIGKTFSSHKFTLDWANEKQNQDIDFIFPLSFRQLNLLEKEKHNLIDVIQKCFKEMEKEFLTAIFTRGEENKTELKVLFILDGLDEFQMPLNYKKYDSCDDVTEPKTIDVLLTNLIMKDLLPSALLWITSRPVAANQIPSDCVDLVTEVRGFNDDQKDEYIMKRCSDEILARRIISHIKTSRILYIMCHIPVIALIITTVLKTCGEKEMPRNLTQVYIRFLVDQVRKMDVKYNGKEETDAPWDENNIKMIQSLGKLAFTQLEKGNLIFREADLRKCGIDVEGAANCSGMCTEIFSEDKWGGEEKVYCFVHLTIQELFAALHVFLSFINNNKNVMEKQFYKRITFLQPAVRFYKSAVDRTLESEKGHLDLFLRFLLGLSMESNQTRLTGLLTQTTSNTQSHEKTIKYIKEKIRENPSPERSMNLFHCLNELNDHSLVEEIQHYLSSGSLSSEKKLSSTQWSALVFVLLTSEEKMDVFDLKKYFRSEEGLLRLLPVVKDSKTAMLNDCNLSERCCEALASALPSSDLTELDLSNNNLGDSGMKLISAGLENPLCKLETLRLSGCHITEEGCASLSSALKSASFLRQLELSNNDLKDAGMNLLSAGLGNPLCKLETLRLSGCHITEEGCASLSSALKSASFLRQLELSNNDLKDAGMKLLSAGLGNPLCKLETLRLSGCLVTEEGCASLASALRSIPFHLRELDLSYNHPGEKGLKLLSAGLGDPHCRLEKLNVDHGGECWIKPGLRKYACELTLDPNTAHRYLSLCEENRKVTCGREKQPYPDHPERFENWPQVLCREGLSGRCYWEAEWSGGGVSIAVTYKGIIRRGRGDDCVLGYNNKSWSLYCVDYSYSARHNKKSTVIPDPPSSSHRVGVYLDWPAGTLSFYTVSSDTLTHLHTFHSTFTEPLYPGFWVCSDSSVSLCQVEQPSQTVLT
ncbi:NACHT, LRR and PYD domains-containing protein 12-like isoform X2 [Hypomesus transpacificus]|nr:NACHT, LRR and PYD domains-containing protein 12-like isoform X2 [Hypomesus transpacificus]XP_046881714.1 NACHT, LRR and PYD domains-containing protein 12-like isoform X2 [Hypomesus transpacificus]XP_046881715.1 NACHT, LRR and PYD domains-containing protein 12-like isoform X2 [Hypomesus transpacificus]